MRAESRLGRTRVIATLAAAIGAPPIDRAHEGQLAIHVDSSAAEGVGAELAVELGRTLEQLLRHARAVDLESLCIVPARAAWCLRMDVRVVHNDGALMDACALAALAAAKAFRRPEHRVRSRTGASSVVDVIPLHAREGVRLTLHHTPFCVTFVAFRCPSAAGVDPTEDGEATPMDADDPATASIPPPSESFVYCVDPTAEEEGACDAVVVVAADAQGNVRLLRKHGGLPLPRGDLGLLVRLACVRARDLDARADRAARAWEAEESALRVRRHRPLPGAGGRGGRLISLGGEGKGEGGFTSAGSASVRGGGSAWTIDAAALMAEDDAGAAEDDAAAAAGGGGAIPIAGRPEGNTGRAGEKAAERPGPLGAPRAGVVKAKAASASDASHLRDAFTPSFLMALDDPSMGKNQSKLKR